MKNDPRERGVIGGLIIRRRTGESVRIRGGSVYLTVEDVGQNRVTLRFQAGPEMIIERDELQGELGQ